MNRQVMLLVLATVVLPPSAEAMVVMVKPGDDLRKKVQTLGRAPGTIVVTPGTYDLADTIDLTSAQSMHGQYGQSVIRWTGPLGKSMIRINGTKGPLVGTMTANHVAQSATISQTTPLGPVELSKVVNGIKQREDNVVVANAQGVRTLLRRPILLYPEGADLYALAAANAVTIEGLTFDGTGAPNVALAAVELNLATNFRMQNCVIHHSDLGVWARESFRITVERSHIESTRTAALRVEGSTVATLRRNVLLNAGRTGISLADGVWICNLIDNDILGTVLDGEGIPNGGDGVNASSGGQLHISNNRILGAGCYGIWLSNFVDGVVIANNTITGGITAAVVLSSGTEIVREAVIVGNIITNNNGGSIALAPGGTVAITNNALTMIRGGGVSGEEAGEVTITANVATDR